MSAAKHTPGPLMAGIERQISHFRDDPLEADATPSDVISVANIAAHIDAQRGVLLNAVRRTIAWHDRQGGHGAIPSEILADLRAALSKAEGRS